MNTGHSTILLQGVAAALFPSSDHLRIQGPSPIQRMKCTLWKLPRYLVLAVKRFSKNNFFIEKNPTIVTFPVKNLDLRECETASVLRLHVLPRLHMLNGHWCVRRLHFLVGPICVR